MCESPLYQAQRNNEDINAIEPLFSVNIDHRVSHVWTLKLEQMGANRINLVKFNKHSRIKVALIRIFTLILNKVTINQ